MSKVRGALREADWAILPRKTRESRSSVVSGFILWAFLKIEIDTLNRRAYVRA